MQGPCFSEWSERRWIAFRCSPTTCPEIGPLTLQRIMGATDAWFAKRFSSNMVSTNAAHTLWALRGPAENETERQAKYMAELGIATRCTMSFVIFLRLLRCAFDAAVPRSVSLEPVSSKLQKASIQSASLAMGVKPTWSLFGRRSKA